MNKKETNKLFNYLILYIVIYITLRALPEILKFDDAVILAVFDGINGSMNIIALILVAIQINHSNKQLSLLQEQDSRTKIAILRLKPLDRNNIDYLFNVYNLGLGAAYDINITVFNKNMDTDNYYEIKTVKVLTFSDALNKTVSQKFKNEILLPNERLLASIDYHLYKSKSFKISISYKDGSSDEIKNYSLEINTVSSK